MGEAKRRSKDATPDQILPPGSHAPIQPDAAERMRSIMNELRKLVGDRYEFAIFLIEKEHFAEGRLPRFNYGATVDRADMVNVLNAFVQKNAEMLHIDAAIKTAPPTSTKQ